MKKRTPLAHDAGGQQAVRLGRRLLRVSKARTWSAPLVEAAGCSSSPGAWTGRSSPAIGGYRSAPFGRGVRCSTNSAAGCATGWQEVQWSLAGGTAVQATVLDSFTLPASPRSVLSPGFTDRGKS